MQVKLTSKTPLSELIAKGADQLGDIPLVDLAEYLRYSCIEVSKDMMAEDPEFADHFADAAAATQEAIEALDRAIPRRD